MINDMKDYIKELNCILDILDLNDLEEVIELLKDAFIEDGQIFVMGNGGSAATASHFACDINKGVFYSLDNILRFKVTCLNDNIPTILAYANDISYDYVFVEQLKNFMRPGDIVMGFSGSGNSINVIKAIEHANENGAVSIGFTGYEGGKLSQIVERSIIIHSNDMQKIEDVHVILTHIIMQTLRDSIGELIMLKKSNFT